jgi:hypothetical protein
VHNVLFPVAGKCRGQFFHLPSPNSAPNVCKMSSGTSTIMRSTLRPGTPQHTNNVTSPQFPKLHHYGCNRPFSPDDFSHFRLFQERIQVHVSQSRIRRLSTSPMPLSISPPVAQDCGNTVYPRPVAASSKNRLKNGQ